MYVRTLLAFGQLICFSNTHKMTLKQITEDNFSSLLRSMDPSFELLGRLTSVPFISDRIFSIDQLTDGHKNFTLLNALRQVPGDIEESVINGFISALRSSGQDHVANIFRKENDKVILSEEHYKLLRTKRPSLCEFLNARDCFYRSLISSDIFSETDKRKIFSKAELNDMADKTIEVLLRKSDDAFDKFVTLLHETGQSHVAYILSGEGNSRPLKEEHRRLLSSRRDDLVKTIDSKCSGLITALMSKGVFSSYDEQRVTSVQPNTIDDRNEMILNLISRKSQTDFFNFISALNDTDQTHVVVDLIGAEVVAKIKTVYESGITHAGHIADVDAELLEYMQEMFQRNGIRLNEILSQNGLAVSGVRDGCIEVTFTCKSGDSLRNLHDLSNSGELENMLNETFCSQFTEKGLKSLKVEISNDQFEQCAHKFARWIPMTSEHREALLSSAELLVDKMTVDDDLLDKLSLCKRRRNAIENASAREQQVKTLIDIISRQPDSAFTQLLNSLYNIEQIEASAVIISRDRGSATMSRQPDSVFTQFIDSLTHTQQSEADDDIKSEMKTEDTELHMPRTADAWKDVDDNLKCLLESITNRDLYEEIPPMYLDMCSTLRGGVMSIHNLREQHEVPTSRPSIETTIDAELDKLQPLSESHKSTELCQGELFSFPRPIVEGLKVRCSIGL